MLRRWEKARIIAEMGGTLSRDPMSVRFLRTWVRTLRPGHSPLGDRLPWMNFKAIRWLDSYMGPGMTVFEYGTGGSTVFIARRVGQLISVESDAAWYSETGRTILGEGIANCDLRFIPPRRPTDGETGPYVSTAKGVSGLDFEAYVRSIDGVPDQALDLVIVDGYARLACVAHAVPKVRPGGYIMVDDTDWRKYRRTFDLLRDYPRTDFIGVTPFQRNLRQTSIWRVG